VVLYAVSSVLTNALLLALRTRLEERYGNVPSPDNREYSCQNNEIQHTSIDAMALHRIAKE
jgi:hypothetical protein